MKHQFIPVFLAAGLSGCAVISPYEQPYSVYTSPPDYSQPYTVAPGYSELSPVYRAPLYVGPPVRFSFRLNFWSGRGGRHWHHHGFGWHGFGRHGFGGGRGGWKH